MLQSFLFRSTGNTETCHIHLFFIDSVLAQPAKLGVNLLAYVDMIDGRTVPRVEPLLEPLLLGDVNQDGSIDLFDVSLFVAAIADASYLPAADVNQDGVVDLPDVAVFVELLIGN